MENWSSLRPTNEQLRFRTFLHGSKPSPSTCYFFVCASKPLRLANLSQYKLLRIQTAKKSPGRPWQQYDTAFCKDMAATDFRDWSKMNHDLYNFHALIPNHSSSTASSHQTKESSASSSQSHNPNSSQFYHPWNDELCRWPFGCCRFRHSHHVLTSLRQEPDGPDRLLHPEIGVNGVEPQHFSLVNSVHSSSNFCSQAIVSRSSLLNSSSSWGSRCQASVMFQFFFICMPQLQLANVKSHYYQWLGLQPLHGQRLSLASFSNQQPMFPLSLTALEPCN